MPRCRPFKLVNAMILVGVAALGLAAMRPGWNQFQSFWTNSDTVGEFRSGHQPHECDVRVAARGTPPTQSESR